MADLITQANKRSRAHLRDILASFASRLREIGGLNAETVVVSDQPIPLLMPAGGYCVAVSAGGGRFPGSAWQSGHHATATNEATVIVGIYLRRQLDRPGRAEAAMIGDESLVDWFQRVLAYLTVADPLLGTRSQAWEPSKNGIPLLRSIPVPVSHTGPMDVPGHAGWIGQQITFAISFDWELYSVG